MGNKQKIQKSMYGILKDSAFKKNEKGNLVVKGYFTSDNLDMAGDVITRDATERALPMYKQWGNVRYLHTPKPVGKVRRIGIQDGLEWNEAEIEVIDPDAIFQVENELLTALSVGILVDFKDIDIDEETGGFIINNYTLAEISLVDHPANYDARLKDIVLDDEARHLALQYGLDGLANHIGGKNMTEKEKDVLVEEEEIIESPEAEEELDLSDESQEVSPEEVVEDAPEEEEEEEVEISLEAEEEIEDESEEDIEDSEEEAQEEIEDVVTVEDSADAEIEKDISEEEEIEQEDEPSQEDLSKAVQEIRESLKAIADALESGKGSEEEQETDDEDALQKELKAIKEQNEQLEARLKELEESTPAERKGLVEETNLDDLEEEEEEEEVQEIPSLKKALRAHFERKLGK
jgi:hypothetical protein